MQSGKNSRNCYRHGTPATMTRPSPAATLAAAALLVAFAASGAVLDAQSPPPSSSPPSSQPTQRALGAAQIHKHNADRPSPSVPAPAAIETPPPELPRPDWPVNDMPVPAKVTWDTRGLTVEANNSSLDEILKEVATETGARLQGKVGDERVFGSYGPGAARDVITQLLDGTAYNVLMVGDQGEGTPRQIVLSNRPAGPAPTGNAQNNNEEGDYDPPQQPAPAIPIMRNGLGPPGMPPEQNQQMMEERRAEIEQRQEQLRQQQQQQEQQQQPQTPPQ